MIKNGVNKTISIFKILIKIIIFIINLIIISLMMILLLPFLIGAKIIECSKPRNTLWL